MIFLPDWWIPTAAIRRPKGSWERYLQKLRWRLEISKVETRSHIPSHTECVLCSCLNGTWRCNSFMIELSCGVDRFFLGRLLFWSIKVWAGGWVPFCVWLKNRPATHTLFSVKLARLLHPFGLFSRWPNRFCVGRFGYVFQHCESWHKIDGRHFGSRLLTGFRSFFDFPPFFYLPIPVWNFQASYSSLTQFVLLQKDDRCPSDGTRQLSGTYWSDSSGSSTCHGALLVRCTFPVAVCHVDWPSTNS